MPTVTSTATLTINPYPRGFDNTQRTQIVRGTIAITTGLYPSGGYSVSWGSLTTGDGGVQAIPLGSSTPTSTSTPFPIDVDVKSVAYATSPQGFGPSGYIYVWDNVNGNIHIFQSTTGAASGNSGPLVEFAGAVPNTIVNDVILFRATFIRNV
jgi:hypothetical protein